MPDAPTPETPEESSAETRRLEDDQPENATRRIDANQLFAALEPEPEPIPPPSPIPAEAQAAPTAEPTQYIDEPPMAPPTQVASVVELSSSPQPSAAPSQPVSTQANQPTKDNRLTIAIVAAVVVLLLACICACTALGVIAILANSPGF
jgi:hypothetical protein